MLKFAERMPARKTLIDRFVYGKQPTLRQMALDAGTALLDTLWGVYFATGSPEPVAAHGLDPRLGEGRRTTSSG